MNYPSNTNTVGGPVSACVIEQVNSEGVSSNGHTEATFNAGFTLYGGTTNGTITFVLGGGNVDGTITPGAITSTVTNSGFVNGDAIIQSWSTVDIYFTETASGGSATFISPWDNATQPVPTNISQNMLPPMSITYYDATQ
jgi:hypothetical protein